MKSEKIRLYVIEITLVIFFLLAMIFNETITRTVLAIILLVFMVITVKLIKSEKMNLTSNKQIAFLFGGMGIIYVAIIYFLGMITGFYSSTVKLSIWSIINYIIPYIVIIISAEVIRKTVLLKESKYSKIIILIATVMLDVILTTNIYNLKTAKDYFTVISFVIFASIANNLLFNYMIIKHRNMKAIIIYRLITTLYVYIIPITPDIYIFLESIIRMVIPYLIYIIIENTFNKRPQLMTIKERKKSRIITVIVCIIIGFIVMLVSCKFAIGALVIGSGSMTGTIDKGDIIVYERYGKNESVKTGDIIIFRSDDLKIVHRVIDQKLMGEETRYYTKGDANQKQDDGYRTSKDVIGQVKFKIPYIGYLTLWVNNLIGGNK